MVRIVYDRDCDRGEVFPMGWGMGVGLSLNPNPETRLHLPKRRSLTGWFTTLHEYAHYAQFVRPGGCVQAAYVKHMLYYEAQASALALRWIAPEYQARARRFFVRCLNEYIVEGARLPSSYWCTTRYLERHLRRLER
jgi:hypothetical protein